MQTGTWLTDRRSKKQKNDWWCGQYKEVFIRYNANGKIIEGPAFFNVSIAFRCFLFFFRCFTTSLLNRGEAFFLEVERRITKSHQLSFLRQIEFASRRGYGRWAKRILWVFCVGGDKKVLFHREGFYFWNSSAYKKQTQWVKAASTLYLNNWLNLYQSPYLSLYS